MIAASQTRLRALAAVLAAIMLGLPSLAHGMSIPEAKTQADGTVVTLQTKLVTYVATDFFYVQEANRSISASDAPVGGIRVNRTSHGFTVGARVNVTGTIRTNSRLERYIECSSAATATGTGTVAPWMMSNRSIGENTVGLLVKTTGFVHYVDSGEGFAYVDDGSSLRDGNTVGPQGSEMVGICVIVPASVTMPKTTQYVTVTGVCSLEMVAGASARVLLAQSIDRNDSAPMLPNMNMICVPGGEFLMGNSGTGDDATHWYQREFPQHPVYVPMFWISKCEVTRAQYRSFINAGGYSSPSYWSGEGWSWKLSVGRAQPSYWSSTQTWVDWQRPDLTPVTFSQTDSCPVVGVTFYEAEAFCKWAGGRLPTEAEWEKAARWDGTPRVYPWGNEIGTNRCNDWFDTIYPGYKTAPVASGASLSPYGCADMAGNVWEWTSDWYKSYPGSDAPFDKTGTARSLRGGGWYGDYGDRCASRWFSAPGLTENDIGFRIAR